MEDPFFRWRFLKFVLILVGYFCTGFLFTLSADNGNLVLNSSFETGSDLPDNWTAVNGVACGQSTNTPPLNFDWDDTLAHSGLRSVALKNLSWPSGITFTPGSWVSSDFIQAASFPQEYEVTVWVLGTSSNINLRPILWVCQYGETGNVLVSDAFSAPNLPGTSWIRISIRLKVLSGATQLKLGLGGKCSSAQACSGSLWFDDVTLRMIGKITAHKFEDVNRNGQQDLGEQNLSGWRMNLFSGSGCTGDFMGSASTDAGGNRTFDGGFSNLLPGEYSIAETLQGGWENTTPVCQNVSLVAGQTPQVNFGNVKSTTLAVPYFGQADPAWGLQEYDHGNSLSLWCGRTIAHCGCALTSAAMLLKYYGVDRSPTGELTTPETLNNWLKANGGYDFGGVKWTSIGSYSIKANEKFGTQKIKFTGYGNGANDFPTLIDDLNNNRPDILEVPNHFIAATGIQGSTYSIHDPRWRNKTTLEAYGGHFRRMRRFEKTSTDLSTIYISTPAPTKLFLTDYQGRRAGKDPTTGVIYNEIPASFYTIEPVLVNDEFENGPPPPIDSGVTTLIIINPEQGTFNVEASNPNGDYEIKFSGYDRNGDITTNDFHGKTQQYTINYSPEPGAQIEVAQIVDIDIKPSNGKNVIKLEKDDEEDDDEGIKVAVLTTPSFDANTVNVKTVRFGPGQTKEIHDFEKKNFKKQHFKDIDKDGDLDLVLHFGTKDTGFKLGDTQACLTGETITGSLFKGCDAIKVVAEEDED